ALAHIEPGGGLVEAQQHRFGAHGARDLDAPLLAIGQVAGRIVRAAREADAVDPVFRLVDRCRFGVPVNRKAEQGQHRQPGCLHQRVVLGDQQILEHRHAGEEADVLERTGDARELGDAEIEQALEQIGGAVRMREADHADARVIEPRDAVEDRGLAGAVGADERCDVAALRREAHIIDRDQAAKPHAQVLDGKDGIGRRAHERPSATRSAGTSLALPSETEGVRVATSPRGRQIMISTMAMPNTSMRYCANSRNSSKAPSMAKAAIATPSCEPMPPSTTIASTSADSEKVKDSGLMKPWRVAKNDPAMPPNMAPMAKAVSLVVVVLMPSERQAISSSRSASQARPIGRRRRRNVTQLVSSAKARIK